VPPLLPEPPPLDDPSSPIVASSEFALASFGLDDEPPLLPLPPDDELFRPCPDDEPPLLPEPPPLLLIALLLLPPVLFGGGVFSDDRSPVPLAELHAATAATRHTPMSIE
jgi:hypothetical protein